MLARLEALVVSASTQQAKAEVAIHALIAREAKQRTQIALLHARISVLEMRPGNKPAKVDYWNTALAQLRAERGLAANAMVPRDDIRARMDLLEGKPAPREAELADEELPF